MVETRDKRFRRPKRLLQGNEAIFLLEAVKDEWQTCQILGRTRRSRVSRRGTIQIIILILDWSIAANHTIGLELSLDGGCCSDDACSEQEIIICFALFNGL